jgi:hypothetical protein
MAYTRGRSVGGPDRRTVMLPDDGDLGPIRPSSGWITVGSATGPGQGSCSRGPSERQVAAAMIIAFCNAASQ